MSFANMKSDIEVCSTEVQTKVYVQGRVVCSRSNDGGTSPWRSKMGLSFHPKTEGLWKMEWTSLRAGQQNRSQQVKCY